MRFLTILFAALGMVVAPLAPAHAQLKVDVVGERYIPLRIAIPDFDAAGHGAAEAAAQITAGDPRRTSQARPCSR